MTPLTVDCARARQLLPDLLDPASHPVELDPTSHPSAEDRAFVEGHLAGCPGCREAERGIADALRALEHLSPTDVARLRALADGELDTRPLARLVVACVVGAVLVALGVVVTTRAARAPAAAPAPQVQVLPPPPVLPHVTVGAEVGLEEDTALLAAPIELPDHPPTSAAPLAEAPAPPAPEALVAAPAPPAAPAPAPAGGEPAAVPVARPLEPPAAPPAELLAQLERLQLSTGVRFRDVTLYFARDPQARDRLGRGRGGSLLTVREVSPPEPERCVLRPPGGQSSYRLLAGELLDAPCGLRVATTSAGVSGRVEVAVQPAGFDGLAVIEGRARRDPVLRAPVLLPSRARAALLEGQEPGPVAVLLNLLADPTLLEFERLRRELGRLEPEARELERRLRPKLEDERGLRGVAISVRGTPRSLDLFASSRGLSEALPRLLRAALLEAALERQDEDDQALGADPRSAQIDHGIEEGRDAQQALLAALPACRGDAAAGDRARVLAHRAGEQVATMWLSGDDLLHAAVVRR